MSRGTTVHRNLAHAIVRQATKAAKRNNGIHVADVLKLDPLQVELRGSDIILEEGSDLIVSQGVKTYDGAVGLAVGDNVIVQRTQGNWHCTDVVSSTDASVGVGHMETIEVKLINGVPRLRYKTPWTIVSGKPHYNPDGVPGGYMAVLDPETGDFKLVKPTGHVVT